LDENLVQNYKNGVQLLIINKYCLMLYINIVNLNKYTNRIAKEIILLNASLHTHTHTHTHEHTHTKKKFKSLDLQDNVLYVFYP